jgi:hypothetical protein
MRNRPDLTNWVMHFVHDRDYKNESDYVLGERFDHRPYDFLEACERKFEDWDHRDTEYPLSSHANALGVLLKILDDGHIRRGWSLRGERATIYGPKAACCFTEMPLYAILDYAKARGSSKSVLPYGIGLPRHEFFRAGGRPVIYGLSGEHRETHGPGLPRLLHPSCGIAPQEQYRYVAMCLDDERRIDWTHEREWRWCDPSNSCRCPGLPIWLAEEPISFTRSLIFVNEEREVTIVLDKIKELYDAGSSDYSDIYSKKALADARVFSVERLVSLGELSRLDDLPSHRLSTFERPNPSAGDTEVLRRALAEASEAAALAARRYREEHPRSPNGHYIDSFGTASLMVDAPQSLLVEALISIGAVDAIGGVGYRIKGVFESHCRTGMLTEQERAAEAALKVLEGHYPGITLFVKSWLD